MEDIITGVTALAAVLLFFLYRKSKTKRYKLPPGPRPLPIIGNLHQLQKLNPQRFFYKWAKTYGPIFSYKTGSRTMVVISSAKLAKEILKTQDVNFANRAVHRGQETMSYGRRDLAFNHYTPYYREMRKMGISHLFSPTRVATFKHVREEEAKRMMFKIEKAATERSKTVDISELMLTFTNTVVCRQAFGKKYNEDDEEMKRFIEILYGTQSVFGMFFFSDYFPIFRYFLDDLTRLTAYMKECFERQDTYLQELVDEALNPDRVKPETESMIDLLLEIYKEQPFAFEFTIENVKAVVMNIIIAGTDTAAAAVVWGMTYLMKYPQVMKKAQEELRDYAKERRLTFVTEDDVENLPYFKALVKETLRIEPAIPLPRNCSQDTKIAGYDIPKGTTVSVNGWAISREEKEWGPNSEEFRPERFLEKEVNFKGTNYEFLPFGSGRRMCPGMRLGIAMFVVPYANLLLNFNFKLPNGVKAEDINMDVMAGLAMHKSEHLMLVPKKVSK